MPSTYTNDLRLELIAVGEGAGSAPNDWGSKTNVNLTSIAAALGAGIEQIASDGDATLTLADGAADEFRSLFLKITSAVSLTATRTLTFAPNTISKVWIVENATTGGQSITISQGSGANVTIENGQAKLIYTDGAGSGAAVVDALSDLDVGGTFTVGTAASGVSISPGSIDLKNSGGSASSLKFYCEVSNAHYIELKSPAHAQYTGNITLTLPPSDGNAGEFLQTDGSGNMSWGTAGGAAYTAWAQKNSDFTASAGDQLICNHPSTPFTITLPSSPSVNDTVVISNAGLATVTVARNSSNIRSLAQDFTLAHDNSTQLVYVDSTIGWHEI